MVHITFERKNGKCECVIFNKNSKEFSIRGVKEWFNDKNDTLFFPNKYKTQAILMLISYINVGQYHGVIEIADCPKRDFPRGIEKLRL